MILSLSPGPTNISHAAEVARYAQMWRIMDDMWDAWTFPHNDPSSEFPNGIRNAFDRLAQWSPYVRSGRWPDADMLPFGSLHPHPGWGDPRQSRLTETETRTAFTLWAIARSPLILGGNLTEQPAYLQSILTNKEVIALDQEDRHARRISGVAGLSTDARIWTSSPRGRAPDTVALFNVGDAPLYVNVPWTALGLAPGSLPARNLWTGAVLAVSDRASFEIAPHDVVLLRLAPRS
jgi:hypothetical protein